MFIVWKYWSHYIKLCIPTLASDMTTAFDLLLWIFMGINLLNLFFSNICRFKQNMDAYKCKLISSNCD